MTLLVVFFRVLLVVLLSVSLEMLLVALLVVWLKALLAAFMAAWSLLVPWFLTMILLAAARRIGEVLPVMPLHLPLPLPVPLPLPLPQPPFAPRLVANRAGELLALLIGEGRLSKETE